ncbi:hypothetical protein FHW68_001147 [Pseudomonas sp. Tn43]|nr:hypothetical protein [Pseudomonas sp. Tn43]
MWRGGLPPLGRKAAPKPAIAVYQYCARDGFTTASQSNGGKPPRHRQSLYHRMFAKLENYVISRGFNST